jgi:hypothetical protein
MRHQVVLGSLAILSSFVLQPPAWAQDCGPLAQIASLDMTPVGNNSVMTVPASFNGTIQPMLVNTGGGISNMRSAALDGLGLHAIDASRIKMLDAAGNASKRYVQVDDFAMGAVKLKNLQFIVSPNTSPAPFAGSLAGDIMEIYDVEMDFAGRKLNFFSKEHCPGHVLYWKPAAVAVLPIIFQEATGDSSRTGFRSYVYRVVHVIVPITLDGKEFQARIDTGSARSTIPAAIAKYQFNVAEDSAGSTPGQTIDGHPDHATFSHVFSSLTFDAVSVTNPRFTVLPAVVGEKDPGNSVRVDSRVRRDDDNIGGHITIGMDVLRKLHLYIAFGERKLYVTPASTPVALAQ